ncbi:MAG: Hpt domain-containing protein [Candidatus Aceula meridiana]|nr:Hpt domain-containing protein [Candidatus Aceula meridiana]
MSDEFQYDIAAVATELRIRPEILKKLLESFSNTLSEKIIQLDMLVPVNDTDKIRAIMHEVKGTGGNLRLTKVYETADTMHVAVKAEEPQNKILNLFEEFKEASNLFIEHIKHS